MRARAFDEAGRHDARAELPAGLDAPDQLAQYRVVVGQVAHRRHAAGHLQHRVPRPLVAVHVEQPGQQRASTAVDHRRARREFRAGRSQRGDAAAVDVHVRRRRKARPLSVEHPHVAYQQQPVDAVPELFGQRVQQLVTRRDLKFEQPRHLRFAAGFDDVAPAGEELGEEAPRRFVAQPDELWKELDAADRDQRNIGVAGCVAQAHSGEPARLERTRRIRRATTVGRGEQDARGQPEHRRAAFERHVHRMQIVGGLAAVGHRGPARLAVAAAERFGQRRAERRLAAAAVVEQAAVGVDAQLFVQVRPAAVVAVRVVGDDVAVGFAGHAQRARRLALEADGVRRRRRGSGRWAGHQAARGDDRQ